MAPEDKDGYGPWCGLCYVTIDLSGDQWIEGDGCNVCRPCYDVLTDGTPEQLRKRFGIFAPPEAPRVSSEPHRMSECKGGGCRAPHTDVIEYCRECRGHHVLGFPCEAPHAE